MSTIISDNVAKALDNVEKLDQMELKAEEFENQAEQFQKNSNKVFKRMRCQNRKVLSSMVLFNSIGIVTALSFCLQATAMLVGVVVFVLLIIIIIATSGGD